METVKGIGRHMNTFKQRLFNKKYICKHYTLLANGLQPWKPGVDGR